MGINLCPLDEIWAVSLHGDVAIYSGGVGNLLPNRQIF